jgi:hypothetical protein
LRSFSVQGDARLLYQKSQRAVFPAFFNFRVVKGEQKFES